MSDRDGERQTLVSASAFASYCWSSAESDAGEQVSGPSLLKSCFFPHFGLFCLFAGLLGVGEGSDYSWLHVQRSFLALLRGPCGVPGVELGLTTCKLVPYLVSCCPSLLCEMLQSVTNKQPDGSASVRLYCQVHFLLLIENASSILAVREKF